MGYLKTGTLIITLVVLLNSIELSSQANHIVPEPYNGEGPPSYEIENGVVRLTGNSVGGRAIVVNGYFLGTEEHGRFRAVDPDNMLAIISVRTRRFVEVSQEFKALLLYRAWEVPRRNP